MGSEAKRWSQPAYRTHRTPTASCPLGGLHCAHPTGRFTTDGTGAGSGVAEIRCCWCGERADAPYTSEYRAPAGHGEHHPAHDHRVEYQPPTGWMVPTPGAEGGDDGR